MLRQVRPHQQPLIAPDCIGLRLGASDCFLYLLDCFVRCGLTNSPATNVTYRNTFAKPGGSWSSCSHIFGAGTVLLEHMLCCHTPQQAYQYPALSIDSTFCPSYTHANVTFRGLRWFDDAHVDLCDVNGPGVATAPVSPRAEAGGPTGWKASDLHVRELGCQVPQE